MMFLVLVAMSSTITQAITQDGVSDDNACMVNTLIASGVDREKATQYARRMASFDFAYNDLNAANDLSLRLLGIAENHRAKILACTGNSRSCAQPVLNVCTGHGDCTLNGDGGTASYVCNCEIGYSGNLCHVDVCAVYTGSGARLAARPRCQNGASCIRSTGTCNCLSGFTGEECETPIDNCASKPCYHGGRCENSVNNFSCHCQVGYAGHVCKVKWLTRDNVKQKLGQLGDDVTGVVIDKHRTLASHVRALMRESDSMRSIASRISGTASSSNTLLRRSYNQHKNMETAITRLSEIVDSVNRRLTQSLGMQNNIASIVQRMSIAPRLPKYRVYTAQVAQPEASRRCHSFGGELATVKNRQQQEEIYKLAARFELHSVWLGASDRISEGKWMWWDGSNLDFTNWQGRNPDNYEGNENCLHIQVHSGGGWNDISCEYSFSFVCQFY